MKGSPPSAQNSVKDPSFPLNRTEDAWMCHGIETQDRWDGWGGPDGLEGQMGEMEGTGGTKGTAETGDQRILYFRMVSRMRASSLVDSLRASRSSSIWLRLKMASELVFIRDSNFRLHTA